MKGGKVGKNQRVNGGKGAKGGVVEADEVPNVLLASSGPVDVSALEQQLVAGASLSSGASVASSVAKNESVAPMQPTSAESHVGVVVGGLARVEADEISANQSSSSPGSPQKVVKMGKWAINDADHEVSFGIGGGAISGTTVGTGYSWGPLTSSKGDAGGVGSSASTVVATENGVDSVVSGEDAGGVNRAPPGLGGTDVSEQNRVKNQRANFATGQSRGKDVLNQQQPIKSQPKQLRPPQQETVLQLQQQEQLQPQQKHSLTQNQSQSPPQQQHTQSTQQSQPSLTSSQQQHHEQQQQQHQPPPPPQQQQPSNPRQDQDKEQQQQEPATASSQQSPGIGGGNRIAPMAPGGYGVVAPGYPAPGFDNGFYYGTNPQGQPGPPGNAAASGQQQSQQHPQFPAYGYNPYMQPQFGYGGYAYPQVPYFAPPGRGMYPPNPRGGYQPESYGSPYPDQGMMYQGAQFADPSGYGMAMQGQGGQGQGTSGKGKGGGGGGSNNGSAGQSGLAHSASDPSHASMYAQGYGAYPSQWAGGYAQPGGWGMPPMPMGAIPYPSGPMSGGSGSGGQQSGGGRDGNRSGGYSNRGGAPGNAGGGGNWN